MLVKCKICGNKTERAEAFKVVGDDNKNKYYCNEKEYNTWLKSKEERDGTYCLIDAILERKVTNTALFKEINELAEIYTYGSILAYLKENEAYLHNVMQKEFNSEYSEIRYFTAILKNNLTDFKQKEVVERRIDIDIPIHKFTRKNKRRALVEYEEEVGE